MLQSDYLKNLPKTKYDHLCEDCPLRDCDDSSFRCLVRIALKADSEERERISNRNLQAAKREKARRAKYHKNYSKEWSANNKDKCRKYWRDYRARNLASIRERQRNSYRRANNVTPENYRPKITGEKVLQMRQEYAEGKSLGLLAAKYCLSEGAAYDAITGRTWKNLPVPDYQSRRRPSRGRHVKLVA